jgi:hypothetical protein
MSEIELLEAILAQLDTIGLRLLVLLVAAGAILGAIVVK